MLAKVSHPAERPQHSAPAGGAASFQQHNDSSHAGAADGAAAPSPHPTEPASSAALPPCAPAPPVPPYAAVRAAWPEPALLDLLKQQAMHPTDVNLQLATPFAAAATAMSGRGDGGHGCQQPAPGAGQLLQAVSHEAAASIAACPASASQRFVQRLSELCDRPLRGGPVAQAQSAAPAQAASPSPAGDQPPSAGAAAGPAAAGAGAPTAGRRLADGRPSGSAEPPPGSGARGPAQLPQPPLPSPAAALAAAVHGVAAPPALEAAALGSPAALVGFQGDWLALQPCALPHWDKLSLEPAGPRRAAEFYVLCPGQHVSAARMFIKDVSATFLAMRLGTHSPARTPSHLHVMDGVLPVPADGAPAPDGSGGAAAATSQPAQPTGLGRPPDRGHLRSAVLGFRSNAGPASVAAEPGWDPDRPCYRPRSGGGGGGPPSTSGRPTPQLSPQQQAAPGGDPTRHYWRNLRHRRRPPPLRRRGRRPM
ncbi:hypothetical protein GPECTOR_121g445 [Gonium pectorale]|uniref:Mediator of RNA polymerase II transcription subunit 13 n=1 Tax=Gonium pectorale TaxID=33097 RepID=A0A150FYR3_GONPE|nr:hypothetical protein GPECTOR_121g445 [Gonium pectorale]|eukprot:KXZ42744.1 hypothetical protein GPECTOR_121g445 [Gonium pectorale]